MRIAILSRGDGWHVQDLLRAARKHGHDAVALDFRRLQTDSLNGYDAVISCFMTGGPSQTDTWDPKADPNPVAGALPGQPGYVSKNNVFPTLSLGKNDIYGKPIWLTNNFTNLANLGLF